MVRPNPTIEVLKKDFFFFGLPGGSFLVFLDKHSQGPLGVKPIVVTT
jgi:hypothetical protein